MGPSAGLKNGLIYSCRHWRTCSLPCLCKAVQPHVVISRDLDTHIKTSHLGAAASRLDPWLYLLTCLLP